MKASRVSEEYDNDVEEFLQFTERNALSLRGKFFCPCVNYANGRHHSLNDIRSHLIYHGIIPNYTKWIWHGELPDRPTVSHAEPVNVDMGYHVEDMIQNLRQHDFYEAHALLYEKIENDSKRALYLGCTTFTRLLAVLALVNLKA